VSRNDSRSDRPDGDSTLPLVSDLSGVEHFVRGSSAQPADRQPPGRPEADPRIASGRDRVRHTVLVRERRYRISEAEQVLLTTVGAFRTVAVDDLVRYQYASNQRQLAQDLRNLKDQGLIRMHRLMVGARGEVLEVLALTRKAKAVLVAVGSGDGRQISHVGLVKPREIAHDAALYRMYEAEASQIRNRGGAVRRVVLDHELKATVYVALAKARSLSRVEYTRLQREIARANGLPVKGGRILLPDLRLEYETADGDLRKVDLELATRHYHGAYALEKAGVGFKLYADGSSAARLNARLTLGRAAVPEGPGLIDAILSL
jgi:hypothetical protein